MWTHTHTHPHTHTHTYTHTHTHNRCQSCKLFIFCTLDTLYTLTTRISCTNSTYIYTMAVKVAVINSKNSP